MNYMLSFTEFYRKSLIQIGEKDFLKLSEETIEVVSEKSSHWLIAIQGFESNQLFKWRALVYVASDDGTYQHLEHPFKCGTDFNSLDDALKEARDWEKLFSEDCWYEEQLNLV